MGRFRFAIFAPLVLCLSVRINAQDPAAKRFSAEKHVAGPCLMHFSIANLARLKAKLATTIFGRIANHPGSARAFSELAEWVGGMAEEQNAKLKELTGKMPLEMLALFEGEVSFTLKSAAPSLVEAVLSIELGNRTEDILGVLKKLESVAAGDPGNKLESIPFGDGQATLWPVPWGEAVSGIVGTHLVVASTRDLWEQLTESFASKTDAAPASPIVPQELIAQLAAPDGEILFGIDVGTLRNMAMAVSAMSPQKQEISRALRSSGLHRITWAGVSIGVRDGGLTANAHLGMREGSGDVLDSLRKGLLPVKDAAEAIAQMPSSSNEVYAFHLAPGDLLTGIDRALRTGFPDIRENLDATYSWLEESTGISAVKDLFTLGDLEAYGFKSTPPAGALLDDNILLVRTEDFGAYRKLLDKLVESAGGQAKHVESASGKVEYFDFGSGKAREAIDSLIQAGSPERLPPERLVGTFLSFAGQSICDVELPGGWTAVSASTQALVRHLEISAKGQKLALESELGALAKARLKGGSFASVSQGERSSLAAYNTLLQFATAFAPFLSAVRVDVAQLPPGDLFLTSAKPGWMSLTATPAGFTLHAERGPNMAQATLVGIAGGAVVAGFLVPTLLKGRGEAQKVQCANNLKQLYGLAVVYSGGKGKNWFPYSPDGSVASLQLIFEDEDGLSPRILICPEGGEMAATADSDGHFDFAEENCSYEIVPRRLKNTTLGKLLMYDKAPHHNGGRNVLMTDGSITFLPEAEFQELLAQQ